MSGSGTGKDANDPRPAVAERGPRAGRLGHLLERVGGGRTGRTASRFALLGILAMLWACESVNPVATLQDGATGQVAFLSPNPYVFPDLKSGRSVPLPVKGTLVLPPDSGGLVPLVVMLHGSGGVTDAREGSLGRLLAAEGIGSFAIDSFGPRGAATTITDQVRVSEEQMLADAFAALRLLRTHPRVDPDRIAVMGFSKGGIVAWLSAANLVRDILAPGAKGFAAHVAWYPFCGITVPRGFGAAPHLMLLGGKDDYTPPEPCRRLAKEIARYASLTLREYPDAHHAWDGFGPIRYLDRGIGAGKCDFDLLEDGRLALKGTDLVIDSVASRSAALRRCYHLGVTVGRNEQAARQSRADMLAFLKSTLLPAKVAGDATIIEAAR